MPQFELVSYLSQAFWMLVSFGFLYLLVDYVLFPMIEDVMDERKRVIAENLAAAEKANKAAERVMKAYQDYLLTAEQEASALIQKAYRDTNRLTRQIEAQHERKIRSQLKKAERDLKKQSDRLEAQTNRLSERLAQNLVQKLQQTAYSSSDQEADQ